MPALPEMGWPIVAGLGLDTVSRDGVQGSSVGHGLDLGREECHARQAYGREKVGGSCGRDEVGYDRGVAANDWVLLTCGFDAEVVVETGKERGGGVGREGQHVGTCRQ